MRYRLSTAPPTAVGGAVLALTISACAPASEFPVTVEVTCSEHMPCAGELEIDRVALRDDCRHGYRTERAADGFGAAGPGETYLEIEARLHAHDTGHPDGVVLLDELAYVDPVDGAAVRAPLALACAEAADGRVFWTKNVQPGMSAEIYQPYIVPTGVDTIVVEGHRIPLSPPVSPDG